MAQSKTRTAGTASHNHRSASAHKPASNNGQATAKDWINDSMAAPKHTVESLLEMQRQWLKTASEGSETLAQDIQGLQQARDPVQLLSAQIALVNQQIETLSRQAAAVMQQIYDAQLMWLGQWDEKTQAQQATHAASEQGRSAMQAIAEVQDEWLKATRRWIDSIQAQANR